MAITVRSVSKRFGDAVALDDVTLTVAPGSLTALLGPSGGGKSTLLRIVAGLEVPDSGTVEIDGEDVTSVPVRRRGIGFCFQHYAPFRHLTVRRNVAFGLEVRRRPKAEIRRRTDELLELVRIGHLADRYPTQLSGGQRQRMALARALAIEPRVLLLDEPFGALDAQVRQQLRTWLRELHETIAVTTVLVTHDQEEAMEVADHLAIVNEGRLEQVGAPAAIYDRPANEFVLRFLGPATELGGVPVRPHDLVLHRDPCPGGRRATVDRVTHLGFEVRVDLALHEGGATWVQLSRGSAAELAPVPGDRVWVARSEIAGGDPASVLGGAALGGAALASGPATVRRALHG
ncbi:MAG: sulfate/molybdate ABC transporter ATP-binding protein [Acidimicrobiales bacterium]